MKLLLELSGENPTIPFAEIDCIGTVLDKRAQVALVNSPEPATACRLAMTHRVLEYLGECRPEFGAFSELLEELAIESEQPFAGRAKKVHAGDTRMVQQCSQQELERLIGTMIKGPVSLDVPEIEFRAILSEDRCYFGRVLFTIDRGGYDRRNPGNRSFFHPGVMMPRMARALVNISCAQKGDLLLDPFCGTGGILIESGLMGINAIGSDFDPIMVKGSRQNMPAGDSILADSVHLPLQDVSVDAIVTDLPYGQSVSIKKDHTVERLYDDTLRELDRVLKPGKRAVVVAHRDISDIAARHMRIIQRHEQRVHKSLTRRVLVLEKL
ncbi:MAG: methyltransferase domain-containing protein [Methanoregula sp.]|nr:methyltransferase domain-containing protein [Methanoregula sp.]